MTEGLWPVVAILGCHGRGPVALGVRRSVGQAHVRDRPSTNPDVLARAATWGEPITAERAFFLEATHRAWDEARGGRPSAFAGIRLTGADVFWLSSRSTAGVGGNPDAAESSLRVAIHDHALRTQIDMSMLHLEGALLSGAHLEGALLRGAHLEGSVLIDAHLAGAILIYAHLERANLRGADLRGADLRRAVLDSETALEGASLNGGRMGKGVGPLLADVRWGGANLMTVDWDSVKVLGDEFEAPRYTPEPADATEGRQITGYQAASRSYRLLATALRDQGLGARALRFYYRGEVMDRKVLFFRATRLSVSSPSLWVRWMFSLGLGTIAGYGVHIGRLFLVYIVVVVGFAVSLMLLSRQSLTWTTAADSLVLSVTSFHGRGVQPPGKRVNDLMAYLSGAEAVFGLVIEGLLIAAFTRRVTND